jgi:hypothetical protein
MCTKVNPKQKTPNLPEDGDFDGERIYNIKWISLLTLLTKMKIQENYSGVTM